MLDPLAVGFSGFEAQAASRGDFASAQSVDDEFENQPFAVRERHWGILPDRALLLSQTPSKGAGDIGARVAPSLQRSDQRGDDRRRILIERHQTVGAGLEQALHGRMIEPEEAHDRACPCALVPQLVKEGTEIPEGRSDREQGRLDPGTEIQRVVQGRGLAAHLQQRVCADALDEPGAADLEAVRDGHGGFHRVRHRKNHSAARSRLPSSGIRERRRASRHSIPQGFLGAFGCDALGGLEAAAGEPEAPALDQFGAFLGRGGPDDGQVFGLDGVEAVQDGLGRGAAAVAAFLDLAGRADDQQAGKPVAAHPLQLPGEPFALDGERSHQVGDALALDGEEMLAAGKGVVAGGERPAGGGIPRDRQRVLFARVDEDARGAVGGWGSLMGGRRNGFLV